MQKSNEVFFQFLQSYWDWLPPEIQVYIMLFVAAQQFNELKSQVETERRDLTPRHKLREEILQYAKLKNAWGWGHIRIKITKKHFGCTCEHCVKPMKIIGHYQDFYELTEQRAYLGRSYENAHDRMNHVKSFL